MAVKIMETKTGEVTMTSEQVKRDRTVRKVQKYLSVAAVVLMVLMLSAITVFATDGTAATPATNTPEYVTKEEFDEFKAELMKDRKQSPQRKGRQDEHTV